MKTLKAEPWICLMIYIILLVQFEPSLGSSEANKDEAFVEFDRNYTGVYFDCEDFMEYNGIPRQMKASDMELLTNKIHTRFDKIMISYHVDPHKRDSQQCLESIAKQNIIINGTGSQSTIKVVILFRIGNWWDVNMLTTCILQAKSVLDKTNLLFYGTVETILLESADGPTRFIENYVKLQSILRNHSHGGNYRDPIVKYKMGLKLDIEYCPRLNNLPSNASLDVVYLVKFWKPQMAELSVAKSVELIKNHFTNCQSLMDIDIEMGVVATWPDTTSQDHRKYSNLVAFWREMNSWAGEDRHDVIFHQAFDAPFHPHSVMKTNGWWRLIPNSSYFSDNGKQFVFEEKSALVDAKHEPLNLTWLRSPTEFSEDHVAVLFNPNSLVQAIGKPLPDNELALSGLIKHAATKFSKMLISADSDLYRNNESYLGRVGNNLILSVPREMARLNLFGSSKKAHINNSLELFMTFDKNSAQKVMELAHDANNIYNGTVSQLIYVPVTFDKGKLLNDLVEMAKVADRLDIIRKFTFGVGLNVEVCSNRKSFQEVMTALKPYFNYFSPKVILISGNVTSDYSLMGIERVFPLFKERFEICKLIVAEYFSGLCEIMEVVVSTEWQIHGEDELDGVLHFVKFWERMSEWARLTNTTVILASAFDSHIGSGASEMIDAAYGWWSMVEDPASRESVGEYIFENKKAVALRLATEKISNESGQQTLSAVHISVIFLTLIFTMALLSLCYMLKTRKSKNQMETDIKNFLHGGDSGSVNGCPEGIKGPYMKTTVELPKKCFRIDEESSLGSGQFGKVCRGTIITGNGDIKEEVAVKMTKVPCPRSSFRGLLFEIKILSYLGKHPHVVELKGAYTAELRKRKAYVFLELCALGSLQGYLRKCKPTGSKHNLESIEQMGIEWECDEHSDGVSKLDESLVKDMSRWSAEIASGMEFIASKHIVHLDLATRNVLLTGDKRAKIIDFGLSRRMYDYQTYVKKEQEPLPWRWMAPESFRKSEFTEKSDVWSFGVLLWEIYSLGNEPYPGLSFDFNFATRLERGLRLDEPPYSKHGIYSVMLTCWATNPERRPTFSELVGILGPTNLESDVDSETCAANKARTQSTRTAGDETNRQLEANLSDKIIKVSTKQETRWLSMRCASLLASVLLLLILVTITWALYGHLLRVFNANDVNTHARPVPRNSTTSVIVVSLNPTVPSQPAKIIKQLEENNFHVPLGSRTASQITEIGTEADINNSMNDDNLLNQKLFNAIDRRDEEAVKILVRVGADVNARNLKFDSPLILATLESDNNPDNAWNISLRILKHLIEHGADIYARDAGNRTFLHNIVSKGTTINPSQFHDIATYLICKNMSKLFSFPGWNNNAPLLLVAVVNIEIQVRTLSLLRRNGVDLNVFSSNGDSILMSVFEGNRSVNLLSDLIANGVEWNKMNNYNATLLHRAAQFGHSDGVKYLLKLGFDVDAVDNDGDTPLHYAAIFGKEGILETVRVLIENGANISIENQDGRTPLVEVLRRDDSLINREEIVHLLNSIQSASLTSTPHVDQSTKTTQELSTDSTNDIIISVNDASSSVLLNKDLSLNQRLYTAIRQLDEDAVKDLVQVGADVNARNSKLNAPLIEATFDFDNHLDDDLNTSIRIIKYLIDHGADVYAIDTESRTFLHNLVSEFTTLTPAHFHDLATYLISRNMSQMFSLPGWTAGIPLILIAATNIEIESRTLSLLQENGVNLNMIDKDGDSILVSVLVGNRSTRLLSDLIDHGADWNHVNNYNATVLHRAAQYGHSDGVKFLLNMGLDANAVTIHGDTPLHYAALFGKEGILETARMLIGNGANITAENNFGWTPFDEGLKRDNSLIDKDAVLGLLRVSPGSPKSAKEQSMFSKEVSNCSPEASLLKLAMCRNKTFALKAMKILIENGTNPNLKDSKGYYFLHKLVGEGTNLTPSQFHDFVVFLLLKRLAHLFNTEGWFRETSGDVPGCKYTYQITTPFQLAVKNLEVETRTLTLLHQFGVKFNARNNLGDNVLCYTALGRRSTKLVSDLVALGVNPKYFGDRGNTLLHYSAAFGSLEQVKYYSGMGVDVNLVNSYGRTPLNEATRCRSEDSLGIITFLLQKGANATIEDEFGDTPLSSVLAWEDSIEKEKALLLLRENQ